MTIRKSENRYLHPHVNSFFAKRLTDYACHFEGQDICPIDEYPRGLQLPKAALDDLKDEYANNKRRYKGRSHQSDKKYCPGLLYEMLHGQTIQEKIQLQLHGCNSTHFIVENGRHRICIAKRACMPFLPVTVRTHSTHCPRCAEENNWVLKDWLNRIPCICT